MTEKEAKSLLEAIELDYSELARSRAQIYRTLSAVYFRAAGEELEELLHHYSLLNKQLTRGALPPKMKRGLRKVVAWLERHNSRPSGFAALDAEFTQLFRGLSRLHSPPPPYESVYLDGGLLYGPSTDRVAQEYRRFRLKVCDNEPPDHIAFELDFMRFLCDGEALAWQKGYGAHDLLAEQSGFLSEHLAQWVPALCENIRRFDATGFYSGIADLTEGWIDCDRRIVRALIEVDNHTLETSQPRVAF